MNNVKVTKGTLADGREIIFFDDSEPYVSGRKTRTIRDTRPWNLALCLPTKLPACVPTL